MPNLPKSKKRSWIPKARKVFGQVNNQNFYNSKRWKSLRSYKIKNNPTCEQCERENKLSSAQCVDHIKPLSLGGTNDLSNLQSLCNSCHAKKSARESVEYRKGIKIYNKNKKKL